MSAAWLRSRRLRSAGGYGDEDVWRRLGGWTWLVVALLLPTSIPAFVVGHWALRLSDALFLVTSLGAVLTRRRLGHWAYVLVTAAGTVGALLELVVAPAAVTVIAQPSLVRATALGFGIVGSYCLSFLGGIVGLAGLVGMLAVVLVVGGVTDLGAALAVLVAAIAGYAMHSVVERHVHREEELRVAALIDPLTGLGNRRALEAEFPAFVTGAFDGGRSLFVSIWDLDDLKFTNDVLGHTAGDDLLRRFATTLRETLHPSDRVFRIGGDEFCCLHVGLRDGDSILARVSAAFPGVSGGFAEVVDGSLESALGAADSQMYARKRRRRGASGA